MCTHFRTLNINCFLKSYYNRGKLTLSRTLCQFWSLWFDFYISFQFFFSLVTSGLELVSYWIGVRLCFGQLYCNERHFALTHNSLQTHIHTQSCESSKRNFLKTRINWAWFLCIPLWIKIEKLISSYYCLYL